MKYNKIFALVLGIALAYSIMGVASSYAHAFPDVLSASPASALTYKGINYVSWQPDEYTYANSDSSLDQLKSTGANYVSLVVTQYMDTGTSNTIYADSSKTPTDTAVVHAIGDIHSRGMKVMLKPHVDCKDGTWRGQINPSDKNAWFSSYSNFINHYAQIAQNNGVEFLCVGTEFESLSGSAYYNNWSTVISGVRGIYTGPLTYAANWTEYTNTSFWSLVDYGGIDAYFPLSDLQSPSVPDIVTGWSAYNGTYGVHNWIGEIENWRLSINKQVILTEIGYRSIDYAAKEPWSWGGKPATYNGQAQANCYEAGLQAFENKSWFVGMFWWDWLTNPNAGGSGDIDYMPQNKPAQNVLSVYYGGYGGNFTVLYSYEDGTTQGWVNDTSQYFGNFLGSPYNSSDQAYNGSKSLAYPLTLGSTVNDAGYVTQTRDFSGQTTITMFAYIPSSASISPSTPANVRIYVKTGSSWTWYEGSPVNIALGAWNKVTMSLSGVSDLNNVRELGLVVRGADTSSGSTTIYVDYVGLGEPSSEPDNTPPAPPTGVTVTDAKTGGTLNVSWTNPTDPDFSHIHIYRSTASGVLGDLAYDSVTGTSKQDTGLIDGTTYYYTLRSADTSGNESTNTDQYAGTPTAPANLALNKNAYASSNDGHAGPPSAVCDGNMSTRWASAWSDPQWIYIDLGRTYTVGKVILYWERAYGKAYQIQVSNDASNWTTVSSVTNGDGGTDELVFSRADARYVRMYGTQRGTKWGYSIWEFEVYAPSDDNTPPAPPTNVTVSDPGTGGQLNLAWTNPTDTDFSHIHIYRSTTPSVLGSLVYDDVTGTSKQDTGLTNGTTYYYTLRSVDTSGNESTNTDQYSCVPTAPVNLALGKTAYASSNDGYAGPPSAVCDGDMGTRWASAWSDPQWIYIDLGAAYEIDRVVLYWEAAYAKAYQIQVSNDASNWTTVFNTNSGNGGTDDISFASTNARYVQMYGTRRNTKWGYSIWEFEVY